MPKQQTDTVECSFCGSSDDKLGTGKSVKTVSGPEVFICRDCVGIFVHVWADEDPEWREKTIEALTKLRDKA